MHPIFICRVVECDFIFAYNMEMMAVMYGYLLGNKLRPPGSFDMNYLNIMVKLLD